MLKDNLTKVLIAAMVISPICGCSIDGLKDISNFSSSAEQSAQDATVNVEALSAQGAKLIVGYATAMAGVTEAQADLAKAYNLDNLASELSAQRTALKSGNITSDTAEKVVEVSEKANKAIEEKMKEQTELDAASKVTVAKALAKYSVGTAGTAMLAKTASDVVTNTKSYLSSLPWTQRANALTGDMTVALNIAKEVPSLSKNLVTTGKSFVEYATAQGVDTTKAQKQMSSIAGF